MGYATGIRGLVAALIVSGLVACTTTRSPGPDEDRGQVTIQQSENRPRSQYPPSPRTEDPSLPDIWPHNRVEGPADMRVESLSTKYGRIGDFGSNTCRYFFAIRNHATGPFNGEVKVMLMNGRGKPVDPRPGGTVGVETFRWVRPEAVGSAEYVDCYLFPATINGEPGPSGDAGVAAFRYEVISGGEKVGEGGGPISQEYENVRGS